MIDKAERMIMLSLIIYILDISDMSDSITTHKLSIMIR